MKKTILAILLMVSMVAEGAIFYPPIPATTTTVTSQGAVGDGIVLRDVVATSGSAIITSASATFSQADVGKSVTLYMGVYTPKTASLSSGSPTMTVANTNGLVVGFGVGGYAIPTNTTISSIANSTTMTLSKNATANATSELYGFYPDWLKSTIASVQSATQVTLADNSTITTTGLRMVYGTDNTTAIQNAINVVATGGTVQFDRGFYIVAGPLLAAASQNSVLTLPNATTLTQVTPIKFLGSGMAPRGQSGFNSDASPTNGAILFCPTKASGTLPAMIGGNGVASTSPLILYVENMVLRSPNNPVLSMVNVRRCGGLSVYRTMCDSDYLLDSAERLPTQNTPALIGPNANSAGVFQVTECEFDNVGVGIATDYHAVVTRCQFGVCRKGVSMYGNDLNLYACHFVGCQQDIVNDYGLASRLFGDADFEDQGTTGIHCTDSISESGDNGTGKLVGFFLVHRNGSAATFPVNFVSTGLHLVVADLVQSGVGNTVAWNPVNVSEKLYTDMNYQARVSGDTTGMQFLNSSGAQLGYIDSNENFSQFFVSAASGNQLILKSGSSGIVIPTTGVVTVDTAITNTGWHTTFGVVTNLGGIATGGISILTNTYYTNVTLNFPSTTASSFSDLLVGMANLKSNDVATINAPAISQTNGMYSAWISNTFLYARYHNIQATAVDPASGIFNMQVYQYK